MRGAFVIRLGRDTRPAENQFEGWVEEVDSGKELRFHSTEELLRFLGGCFELVRSRTTANGPDQSVSDVSSDSDKPKAARCGSIAESTRKIGKGLNQGYEQFLSSLTDEQKKQDRINQQKQAQILVEIAKYLISGD